MKKIRLVIAITLVALMVMGVGYATIWSQNINTTVNGNYGAIDVRVTDASGDGVTHHTDMVSILATTKFVPGSSSRYTFTLENFGSVSALYKTAEILGAVNTDALHLDVYFDGVQGGFDGAIWTGKQIVASWETLELKPNIPVLVTLDISVPSDATAPGSIPFSFEILSNFVVK